MSFETVHINNEPNLNFSNKDISRQCDLIINYSQEYRPRYDLSFFSNVYSLKEINSDTKTVEEINNNFKNRNLKIDPEDLIRINHAKKRSEALEIIIADQIESSDWFGSDSLFFRTTEYDDFVNGIDAVVEFNVGDDDHPERLALAIDSTSNTDLQIINKKIDNNISKLVNNKLEVKYFQSPSLDTNHAFMGALKDVVPVVIGLEANNTNHLITSFSHFIKLSKLVSDTSLTTNQRVIYKRELTQSRHVIEKNPAQLIFLREIDHQLRMYTSILTKENNPNINVKKSTIQKLSGIINGVISEKNRLDQAYEMKFLNNDTVYNLIEYHCQKKII